MPVDGRPHPSERLSERENMNSRKASEVQGQVHRLREASNRPSMKVAHRIWVNAFAFHLNAIAITEVCQFSPMSVSGRFGREIASRFPRVIKKYGMVDVSLLYEFLKRADTTVFEAQCTPEDPCHRAVMLAGEAAQEIASACIA